MTGSSKRDWVVLIAISITLCVAFLVEPDSNLQEAHLLCPGQPVQVFESMTACTENQPPSCPCVRPENPWTMAYWLALLAGIGIAAAFLLRMQWLPGAAHLVGAMFAGGFLGLLFLSRSDSFEPEAWGYAPFVFCFGSAIIVATFGLARLMRYVFLKRRAA